MPISPTVNAWMSQGQQAPTDSTTMFKSAFQDHAFNALRAKASSILPYAVTFKVFDADVDQGNAFGAFAISYGNELVYIPVVMTDGSIISCEMVYLREEDRFVPLSEKYINDIVNKNSSVTGTTMTKDVRVEDTRNMFRNLIRPPASSNVVLASGHMDVADLPDSAKAKVADYLNSNPQLLKKIGEFYPIDTLGEKLAAAAVAPPVNRTQNVNQHNHYKTTTTTTTTTDTDINGVRQLSDIPTPELAKMPSADKQQLKKHGWLLKDAAETVDTFGAEIENNFEEYTPAVKGNSGDVVEALCFKDGVFSLKTVLFAGIWAFTEDGGAQMYTHSGKVLAASHRPASKVDLLAFGYTRAESVSYKKNADLVIFTPDHAGGWYLVPTYPQYIAEGDGFMNVKLDNDDRKLGTSKESILATSALKFGSWVKVGLTAVPRDALFKFYDNSLKDNCLYFVPSMQALYDIIRGRGLTLKVKSSGMGVDITNTKTQRTKSFATEGKAAEYLHDEFGMNMDQILGTLNRPTTFVLSKYAAVSMTQPQTAMPQQQPQPQIMPQGNTSVPAQPFNPSAINSFAAMGDPDMLDAGILTSFAGDPDVKALLVDYLPDFINILDRIGRVILLFNVKRKEMEQYYRIDRINELLQNCRKIFKMVGDLVPDLQLYINMA